MSPFRGLPSTSLRHDDDGADIGPSSRLGNAFSIDDRARFFNQSPILPRMLSMPRPRIDGKCVIILTGSAKPRSRKSAIFRRMLSLARPAVSGKDVINLTRSAKLDDLHDRTELIEPWIGLALMAAGFVLAVWLLPF